MASASPDTAPERVVAGVDLGSNSFHMVVARVEEDGRVHVLDRLRDPVRLAAGVDAEHNLAPEAMERALTALARFGERLRHLPESAVRAVGTNTLRRARNGPGFGVRAADALGHPIEIISGHEEARLLYLGVMRDMPERAGRHLVVDIGGGSTECILGEGLEALLLDSLYMGCVSYTERFFESGRMTTKAFRRAEIAAGLELSTMAGGYRSLGWERATGASGTILAVLDVLRANEWSAEFITPESLETLVRALVDCKHIDRLSLAGLEADRAPVFAGGVAILRAVFEHLGIECMGTSQGALREGLVHELVGRVSHEDPRDRTVETFAGRYRVDRAQAERVESTALELFEQANAGWELDPEVARQFLSWAARLHEVGLTVAYSGYHKHGAYLLQNAEMPGFSIDDQAMLAAMVRFHRRKLARRGFDDLPGGRARLALRLTLLLRLAVCLHHTRSDEPLPRIALEAQGSRRLRLAFPAGWLDDRPLTRADLEQEAAYLAAARVELDLAPPPAQAADGPKVPESAT